MSMFVAPGMWPASNSFFVRTSRTTLFVFARSFSNCCTSTFLYGCSAAYPVTRGRTTNDTATSKRRAVMMALFVQELLDLSFQTGTRIGVAQVALLVHQPHSRNAVDTEPLSQIVLPNFPVEVLRPRGA